MSEGTRTDRSKISVIVPVKNEAENIAPLVEEVREALGADLSRWEVWFVDDGSTDGTLERIRAVQAACPSVHALVFDRNYGQTAAFDAGLRAAQGAVLVTMDGDLQNDPRDIPRLAALLGDADMVCGQRRERHDSIVRRLSSRIANRVRDWVVHDGIKDTGCSLKVMKRECVDRLKLFEGMHRFLPALAQMEGFRVAQAPVNHRPRLHGEAKYRIANRLFKALADLYAVRWMQRRRLHYRIKETS